MRNSGGILNRVTTFLGFSNGGHHLGGVGRRGTNQLRLLERYRDVLDKHTTGIPPPTALVEGTALSALVEGVSLR